MAAVLHWRDLIASYAALPHRDRIRFVKATAEAIPPELWLDIQSGSPGRLDFPDAEIHLRVTTRAERQRLRACGKEPWTVEWIRRTVRPDEVLYDIGANVGAYSLVAAMKPEGPARVFAFEPSYANLAALATNVVLNGVAARVTPLAIALSNRNTLETFHLRSLEPGTARHALGGAASGEEPTPYPQAILTWRLDDAIDRLHLPAPNHIKLDVDGGEAAVLEGAARTVASPGLRSMLVEVSTAFSDEITALLEGHGLRLQAKVRVKDSSGAHLVWYGIFAREEVRAALSGGPVERLVDRAAPRG
jgi:FkbM family methyltransferase